MILFSLLTSLAFAADSGSVTLPWNDFQVLYKKYIQETPKPPPASPMPWTLDRAIYTATVVGKDDDAYALVKLQLRGEVHNREGWTTVPLLSASAALKSAKIGGKDAALFVSNGYYTLVSNQPGAFDAELEFAVRLTSADGETAFTLPLAQAGATVVAMAVQSADDLSFDVAGSAGVNVAKVGNEYRVEAYIPTLPSVTLSWQRKLKDEKAQAARVYAETQTLVGVSEGLMQVQSTVDYTVLHAGVQQFKVALPKDTTVLDVTGAGIQEWGQTPDGTITVTLNYAALGAYRLNVSYEKALAAENRIPLLVVKDVARETDWVGVDARSALELVAGTPTGAVPVDVRELPASVVGRTDFPVLLGFKAHGGDVNIPLEVKSHPNVDMLVTLADLASAQTLVTEDGRRMTRVTWAVRNNRKQFLRVTLPEGAEVWSASVAGRGVKIARDDKGVLIPLVRSDASGGALAGFGVELVYVESGEPLAKGKGWAKLALPRIDAPTSLLQWSVYVPSSLRINAKEGDGTLHRVPYFSSAPSLPRDATVLADDRMQVNEEVAQQAMAPGAMGQGVEPVDVQIPLSGQGVLFEKMLVLDEELWVGFDYRNTKK